MKTIIGCSLVVDKCMDSFSVVASVGGWSSPPPSASTMVLAIVLGDFPLPAAMSALQNCARVAV